MVVLATLVRSAPFARIANLATQVGRNEWLDRSAASANDADVVLGEDLLGTLTHISGQHHANPFGL